MHFKCVFIYLKRKICKGAENLVRKNKTTCNIECLDECDIEDEGFIEGDIDLGKVISTFNFGRNAMEAPARENTDEIPAAQNQIYSSSPRGLTPPIGGEAFTVKRSYTMRPSTVRKLNALKAEDADVNVLFNTIVDIAITHYYSYIFNGCGAPEAKNRNS